MKKKIITALSAGSVAFLSVAQTVNAQCVGQFCPPPDSPVFNVVAGTGFAQNFSSLLSFVLRLVLGIAALLVFFYLILGGIEYITSGGEKGKTEAARNKITSAVIGLIILAASWAILQLALTFLGFTNLNDALNSVRTIN